MTVVNSTGYTGSSAIVTSTANQEVVPTGYKFDRFFFMNTTDCTVKINGSSAIFIPANQGFESNAGATGFATDLKIESFIIVTAGVNFNWYGMFRNVQITQ